MEKLKSAFNEERNLNDVGRIVAGGIGISLLIAGIRNMKSRRATACVQLLSAGYLLFSSVTAFSPLRAVKHEYPKKPKKKMDGRPEERMLYEK